MPTEISIPVERARLDNGLEIVLHRDGRLPLVAVNLWYHTGSKNERPGKTGFAHLFEHMLFQGSANVSENGHFEHVQRVGGVANGSTWYDRTNYFETLPADCLELGLWLESDRMGFLLPAMTPEKLENQREVVMNERRQRVDNQPYGRAPERLQELLFPEGHPYHWPVIGYMDDIEAATLDDVQTFFRTFYAPDNAVLTLAGALSDDVLDLVRRYFDDIPPGPGFEPPAAPAVETNDPLEVIEDDVQLERSYTAYRLAPFGEDAWYAADLLTTVLAGGKSSILHRDLVYERELAQAVGSYALPTEAAGSLQIVATAKPGVSAKTLETEISAILERIREEGPRPEDLERARNKVLTSYFSELQSLDRRADLLSMQTTYFDAPERLEGEAGIYARLGAEDVAAAARSLDADSGARVRVVPRVAAA